MQNHNSCLRIFSQKIFILTFKIVFMRKKKSLKLSSDFSRLFFMSHSYMKMLIGQIIKLNINDFSCTY